MKRGLIFIMPLLFATTFAEAKIGIVKGQYSYPNKSIKGLKAWISGKQDTFKLNKQGRFKVKNADYDKDTLVFESFKGQTIIVPLNGNSIVKIDRDGNKTDIQLSKEERRPSSLYGGVIFTKAELEQTGETSVWKAVMVKSPQKAQTSFYMSNAPLCFVDGVEVALLEMPVKEVAYVEVVKATNASTSAFGVRGANGAILVTTEVKWKSTLEEE